MSNLMNLIIPDETCAFMSEEGSYPKMHQDKLAYSYVYVHNMDINEATKRHIVPAVVRYPHSAPSDVIIVKVQS